MHDASHVNIKMGTAGTTQVTFCTESARRNVFSYIHIHCSILQCSSGLVSRRRDVPAEVPSGTFHMFFIRMISGVIASGDIYNTV